jgi:hypothetical protein
VNSFLAELALALSRPPLIGAVLAAAVYRGITLPTPELPTREAEQALPSAQVERQP